MQSRAARKKIVVFEAIGFSVMIVTVWLNELLDLPSLVGAKPTPPNWTECFIESTIIAWMGLWVVGWTINIINRLDYLEGFRSVCSMCKKIRVDEKWIPIEDYVLMHSDMQFSHCYCPECSKQLLEDMLDSSKKDDRFVVDTDLITIDEDKTVTKMHAEKKTAERLWPPS